MSDTPRTDQMFSTETALSDGELVVPISFARQLERENAALRDAIAESEEFGRKNGETLAAKVSELLRENAALRNNFMFAESEIILLREDRDELREKIAERNAARKEAQS